MMPDDRLYVMLFSVHGLLRGKPELGRDADTGGQILYVLDRVLAEMADAERPALEGPVPVGNLVPGFGEGPECRDEIGPASAGDTADRVAAIALGGERLPAVGDGPGTADHRH